MNNKPARRSTPLSGKAKGRDGQFPRGCLSLKIGHDQAGIIASELKLNRFHLTAGQAGHFPASRV
jgi:hypothetical protein